MRAVLPKFTEARRQMRRPLLGDLSGRLFVAEGNRPICCLAVDVSVSSLRILAHEELPAGSLMILEFETHRIPLVTVWCRKDEKRLGSFACGLTAANTTFDLINLFTTIGWLDSIDETRAWLNNVKFINRFED